MPKTSGMVVILKPTNNKDLEIPGMQLNVDVIPAKANIPDCMMIQQLQQATSEDDHPQQFKDYIIGGWLENED